MYIDYTHPFRLQVMWHIYSGKVFENVPNLSLKLNLNIINMRIIKSDVNGLERKQFKACFVLFFITPMLLSPSLT